MDKLQDLDDVIVLVDEDGAEVEFELVMSLEANNSFYAILATVDDEDDEAYIFRVEEDENGEITLQAIEDDEEYEMVVETYETLIN